MPDDPPTAEPPNAEPLRFRPLLKQTIWGGRRLGDRLNKPIGPDSDYAESWEIVDHGTDQSVVTGGPLAGRSLGDLYRHHRRWLMGQADHDLAAKPPGGERTFPLLFKFLDCNRVLSVQVHPDDAYGAKMMPADLGKTEAWVILESGPESVIYAGLKPGITRDRLSSLIRDGRTEDALHAFHPQVGDCVFIPAGTVHALGGGLLVAEIQQSSNTTFRLFDWNRTDASGQSRPLHIAESLEVTDFQRGPVDPIRMPHEAGIATLVQCDKFELRRAIDTELEIGSDDRCHLISVIDGAAELTCRDQRFDVALGETILLPAASPSVALHIDRGTVLIMSPPVV